MLCSSNASDALDKLRFLSVTEPSLLGDAGELEIRIKPDPDNGTITITSLTSASVASLPYSPSFSAKNSNTQKVLSLRSVFLPKNGLRNSFSRSGLKWKLENRESRLVVRCEAVVAEKEAPEEAGETHEYQAEVSRLLDLIVHSLYSHKEVFLRELVSNASDALDKLRFLSVTEPSLLGDAGELEIRIKPDPDNGTVTITDTGIGMTKEELIDCLGTIAQSGTSKFLQALKDNKDLGADNGLIGQFGVGFYSAFLVAEKVVVSTKSPRSDKQYVWESVADSSSYVIREETDPEKLLRRGTQITLYLRGEVEFRSVLYIPGMAPLNNEDIVNPKTKNIRLYVKRVFISDDFDGELVEEEEEPKEGEEKPEGEIKKTKKTKTEKYWDWELANETKPIWMRNPKEVEKDQYHEFYKKTFNEFLDPVSYIHFTTEGEVEFRSVLYIPGMAPLNNEDIVNPKTKNIRLYVKRVFISDDFDGELSDDKYEFSEPARIQNLVKNYSQFVSFPIYTWQEKSRTVEVEEEEEPKEGEEKPEGEIKKTKKTKTEKYWDWELANETKPIWMRNPKEVEKDQYHEFYKKTFNEFLDPVSYIHFTTEGEVEFRSVLYIPGMAPLNNEDIVNPKTKNIRLYVKRVFISDDFDGELVRIMRKRLVRKTFDMIQELSESENKEDYKKFWENFGKFVKLGCIEDSGNHKRITPLLRFFSSKSEEELISLDEYVENMGENQKAIYYLASDSLKSVKSAPFLEKLIQKDIEVLYLIEPIDEVAIQNLQTYKEKKFVDISKEDLELGDEDEVKERETKQEYILLCDWIKQQLGDKVAKVQVSKRLSSSPCVLVSGKFGWSANMERLMRAQTLGDTSSLEFMRGRRILEINPDHPIVKDLNAACKNAPDSTDAKRAVDLLYDTALISSGFSPDSPAELGNKIYEMMAMALGGRWGRLEEDEEVEAQEDSSSELKESYTEASETEVIEPSEVRSESDPWSD
ncbi:unnamed protein product [Ilex paraguariensis]|uniref:Histidine kinase/HSP90-like ATPase domain-containing protein n=1 Tax=Ilex paraguariensis TaxID=185542 RepID=A0ABC8RBY7_9AQUA